MTLSQPVTPSIAQNIQKQQPSANAFSDILSDLSGLKMEPTVKRATYTGGILAPLTPTKSAELKGNNNKRVDIC